MKIKNKLQDRGRRIKSDTAALYLAFRRKDTPIIAKAIIGIAVCYALSPIDLIPDFIPVLGFLDDVLLLPLLIVLAIRLVPADVLKECRKQAKNMWEDGKPKSIWYALPVVLIWVVIIVVIINLIWF